MNGAVEQLLHRLIRLISLVLGKLPECTALWIGRAGGRLAYFLSWRRQIAYADLKAAFGTRFTARGRWREIRSHYEKLGQMAIEFLRFPYLNREVIARNVTVHGLEKVHKAEAMGGGIIFLTAHFGNWELLQTVSGIGYKKIHVLARAQKNRKLDELIGWFREYHGSVETNRGMGLRPLIKAIHNGEWVGVLGDQDAGRKEGVILSFFGRKTTFPTGVFEIAERTGAVIIPCFMVRRDHVKHDIFLEDEVVFQEGEDRQAAVEASLKKYVALLERYISQYPSEWLWETKRWKYCWTKRLVILSDGKTGHVKQSEAVAAKFQEIQMQYGRPGMEYPTTTLSVRFRSEWRKKLFPWGAFFLIPWTQGRLGLLKWFFDEETQRTIESVHADFVISAGASLVPLNLCLSRESRAKSIVLMKPSFPFNLFRYDLAVVGAHDSGWIPQESFRTVLTPSTAQTEVVAECSRKFSAEIRNPAQVRVAVFLGGPTRKYEMHPSDVERLLEILDEALAGWGDFVLTTSRRTPEEISRRLKARLMNAANCQACVVASEDSRTHVVKGMMALAEILIVTEDSISMISEAVSAGKKVIILELDPKNLSLKHRRFKENLKNSHAAQVATLHDLAEKIKSTRHASPTDFASNEQEALTGRLAAIL